MSTRGSLIQQGVGLQSKQQPIGINHMITQVASLVGFRDSIYHSLFLAISTTIPLDMLCAWCQHIFQGYRKLNNYLGDGNCVYTYKQHTASIHNAASNGCQICAKLCNYFEGSEDHIPNDLFDLSYRLSYTFEGDKAVCYLMLFYFAAGNKHCYISFVLYRTEDALPLFSDNHEPLSSSTCSTTSWEQATKWISECLHRHIECNKGRQQSDWLPTRLLHVGDGSSTNIRLIERTDDPTPSPYLTLSHRWGNSQIARLLSENLNDMKAGIALNSLPRTFRDAVRFSQWLQIHYLWIDSLCIIQNSSSDWAQESSSMSQVYQNALCNISATGAFDSTCGFFFDRNPSGVQPLKVEATWDGIEKGTFYLIDENLWQRSIVQAPLMTRGWVLQERLLAPRVVHFGKEQLFWECFEKEACETYPNDRLQPVNNPRIEEIRFKNMKIELEPWLSTPTGNQYSGWCRSKYQIWNRIIRHYSQLELSKSGDKEAALVGLIQVFAKMYDERCIVGLWEKALPFQLLWTCNGMARRPERYRAPSWSWLSVEGEVMIEGQFGPHILDSQTSSKPLVVVEDIQIDRDSPNPAAPIVSAQIRLRGHLRGAAREKVWCSNGDCVFVSTVLTLDGRRIEGFVGGQDFDDWLGCEEIWCLPVELMESGDSVWVHGLVLQEANDAYKRVGTFHASGKDILHLLQRRLQAEPEREFEYPSLESGLYEERNDNGSAEAALSAPLVHFAYEGRLIERPARSYRWKEVSEAELSTHFDDGLYESVEESIITII